MNIRSKFLRTLDLRVRQHKAGQGLVSSYRLGRLNAIGSLFADHFEDRTVSRVEKPVENVLL